MLQPSPPERLGWKQMAYGQSLVLFQAGPRLIGFAIIWIFAQVIVEFNNMRAAARLIGSYVIEGLLQSHLMLICIRSAELRVVVGTASMRFMRYLKLAPIGPGCYGGSLLPETRQRLCFVATFGERKRNSWVSQW
jgi:hypothetical protein